MRKRGIEKELRGRGPLVDTPALRLYGKAKRHAWDPAAIDLTQDAADWPRLEDDQQSLLQRTLAGFFSGEESVTHNVLPFMHVMASERRLDEELFLTTFALDEAKHTEFFYRYLDAVAGQAPEPGNPPGGRTMVDREIESSMNRLLQDRRPKTQVRAAVTYCLIAEGVLAESGYRLFQRSLEPLGLLPGLREAIRLVKRDESRHVAYGVYLISRLVNADPSLWKVVEQRTNELLPLVLRIAQRLTAPYERDLFELGPVLFSAQQPLKTRLEKIARARDRLDADADYELEPD